MLHEQPLPSAWMPWGVGSDWVTPTFVNINKRDYKRYFVERKQGITEIGASSRNCCNIRGDYSPDSNLETCSSA